MTKAVLIILAHVLTVVMLASFLWFIANPSLGMEILEKNPAKEYKDSGDFADRAKRYSARAVGEITARELFETDGKYNPDKLVDIEQYYNTGMLEGASEGKLIYRLGDLLKWYEEKADEEDSGEQIIVCKRADDTFQYYLISEFYMLVRSNELQFIDIDDEEGITPDNILRNLEYGYAMPEGWFHGIQDSEGRLIYTDCWIYDGVTCLEKYEPLGSKSILDLVNEEKQWNGKLSEVYDMLKVTRDGLGGMYTSYQEYGDELLEGDTNFSYIYADIKNRRIFTNKREYEAYGSLQTNIERMKASKSYLIVKPKLSDFESDMDIEAEELRDLVKYAGPLTEDFVFAASVDTDYPIQDEFYKENMRYERYSDSVRQVMFCGFLAAVLFLVCIVWLAAAAGRRSGDNELYLNWFDYWKTELSAAILIFIWGIVAFAGVLSGELILPTEMMKRLGDNGIVQYDTYLYDSIPYIIWYSLLAIWTCGMFLTGFLSLVRRLKAKTVWSNSLLKSFFDFVLLIIRNMNVIWKTVLLFGGFVFAQLIVCFSIAGYMSRFSMLLLITVNMAAFIVLILQAAGKSKIRKGVECIAGGDVQYMIPLDGLYGEQKEIAAMINTIREGLNFALAESMKNERLKTDLITNVSHDIKTPLTSIINYVELLKQENFEDPKLRRYIEILEQKSQRLKTLTEDVVEASKVSSGNITLDYMDINFTEMLQQTSGEFEEKFKARGLQEILTLPGEEAIIRADGRRTWRVLENVYNNAAKYAMEGTRIYGDLSVNEYEVRFSLKNISEQPLNISADELTERFIRGDISRSTEGSGLGLSIAKTLAEMQGGKFELYLDGDLFKVMISFPRVKAENISK